MKTWAELKASTEQQDRVLVVAIVRLSTTASYSKQTQEEIYRAIISECNNEKPRLFED